MAKMNWNETQLKTKTWVSENFGSGSGARVSDAARVPHELRGYRKEEKGFCTKNNLPIYDLVFDENLATAGLSKIIQDLVSRHNRKPILRSDEVDIIIEVRTNPKKHLGSKKAQALYCIYGRLFCK